MAEGAEQEDKTEEPTFRRLEQAIERGDVANSVEINTFFILSAFTLGLMLVASPLASRLMVDMRVFLAKAHALPTDPHALAGLGGRILGIFLQAVAIPLGMALVAALAAGLLQHRPIFTAASLAPKFDRISPMAGFKRLMGVEALFQFGKGLAKIAIVGIVASVMLWGERGRIEAFAQLEPSPRCSWCCRSRSG